MLAQPRHSLALLAGAVLLGPVTPVHAAVLECFPEMAGARMTAPGELEAKKRALDDWLAMAARIGPGYTRWQIAYNRRIDCRRVAEGHECQAIGRPCTVKQVPNPSLPILKPGDR
jgi:hypothetical protein